MQASVTTIMVVLLNKVIIFLFQASLAKKQGEYLTAKHLVVASVILSSLCVAYTLLIAIVISICVALYAAQREL